MNLQVKFSLIFLLVFGVQLGVAGYVCDGFLQSARDQVIRQARLMMESSLATRTYTEEQIKPLVACRVASITRRRIRCDGR
jgi:protein-histidine pros-kinase